MISTMRCTENIGEYKKLATPKNRPAYLGKSYSNTQCSRSVVKVVHLNKNGYQFSDANKKIIKKLLFKDFY